MGIIELSLIAVGLSMDAFAVAVCKGLKMRRVEIKNTFVIALFFGGFQAIMPLIGWILGKQFEQYITRIDHWIAFVLLGAIGGKMIYEAIKGEEDDGCGCGGSGLDIKELLLMAIATSIDALAVGITLALLPVSIIQSISVIGCTTFLLSIVGVSLGNKFGCKYQDKAQILGGVILLLMGVKILLEHLELFAF